MGTKSRKKCLSVAENVLFIVTINLPVIIQTIKTLETNFKKTKASFLRKALCDKQPAKFWDTVNRILNKQHDRIKLHPPDINNHFTSLASHLTGKINGPYLQNISDDVHPDTFKIKLANYDEVRKNGS